MRGLIAMSMGVFWGIAIPTSLHIPHTITGAIVAGCISFTITFVMLQVMSK